LAARISLPKRVRRQFWPGLPRLQRTPYLFRSLKSNKYSSIPTLKK
jgi:hypothetical protein